MKMYLYLFFAVILSLFVSSCKDEESVNIDESQNKTEVAVTGKPSEVGITYANVNGYVNLQLVTSSYTSQRIGFELATTEDFVETKVYYTKELEGNRITAKLNQLSGNTTYFYRAFVLINDLKYYGEKYSFTTKDFPNITTTGDSSEITFTTSVVSAKAIVEQIEIGNDINIGFAYSTNKSYLNPDSTFNKIEIPLDSVKNMTYTVRMDKLLCGTEYYYCSYTRAGNTIKMSEIKTLKTETVSKKWLSTGDAGEITYTSATISSYSTISDIYPKDTNIKYGIHISTSEETINGIKENIPEGYIYYGYSENGYLYYNPDTGDIMTQYHNYLTEYATLDDHVFTCRLNNLHEGVTYYYRAFAKIDDAILTGEIKSFTTQKVKREGDGTQSLPYNIAAIFDIINNMNYGEQTSEAYYIKGKVSRVDSHEYEVSTNGVMTFDMIDEARPSVQLLVNSVYGPGKKRFWSLDQIKTGDDVIIYGKVVNNGSTAMTLGDGSSYVYSINGSTDQLNGIEVNVNEAVELCKSLDNYCTSTEAYTITGYITNVVGTVSKGQQSFWMADTKYGGNILLAYWASLPENIETFTRGSKVKVTGQLYKHLNSDGSIKPEIKNGDVEILELGSDDDDPDNPSGDAKHITIAEFLSKADTETTYELTGIVKNIVNTTYGNFDLVEGEASIYIYGLLDKDGNAKNFASLGISEGDEVTLTGVYVEYNGKAEIKNAQFISVKKGDNGGNTGGNENTGGESTSSLTNGDFESWVSDSEPTGWKSASTASSATLSKSTDAHGGQYAVCVAGNASQNKRLASKEITLEAGTYKFAFYAKATSANAAQVRPGYVPVTDGKVGNYTYGDYTTISTNWTLVEYEFTLTAQTTVCLVVMNPKASSYSSGEDALIDDATLTKK